jgi:hypothetical protein
MRLSSMRFPDLLYLRKHATSPLRTSRHHKCMRAQEYRQSCDK